MAVTESPGLAELGAFLLLGGMLGTLYFGGLWWTLRRLPGSARPACLLGGSLVSRLALLCGAFYLVVQQGSWQSLLAALLGFMVARMLLTRALRPLARHGVNPSGMGELGDHQSG